MSNAELVPAKHRNHALFGYVSKQTKNYLSSEARRLSAKTGFKVGMAQVLEILVRRAAKPARRKKAAA